ncbi:hypothetical protein CPB84DRAFT_1780539 [Gymnopilus junonius]|uniref:Uncharacterized protein n=1 Tax=Gymnopilus junonius TaxID=109634 RepID=A0A9P5TN97_GYMJU|nr:hypothetical protein CPB84DRAFT_1780539 [Gymnopilus junonius]
MSCPEDQYIQERKIAFCPTLAELDISQLIVECPRCNRYFAACCQHGSRGGDLYRPEQRTCHHAELVFIDSACLDNSYANAKAGMGISSGGDGGEYDYSRSIPVDDSVDFDAPRINQRAELLAAIEGLDRLDKAYKIDVALGHEEDSETFAARHRHIYIIAPPISSSPTHSMS